MNHDKICREIFKHTGKIQAEITVWSVEEALTRFADNVISQNVFKASTDISVRLVDKGKTVKIALNQLNHKDIKKKVKDALFLLKAQKKSSHVPDLIKKDSKKLERKDLYFETTARLSPEFKAEKIKALADKCKKRKQVCYGTLENGWTQITVANSKGVKRTHKESYAIFEVTIREKDGFGWAKKSAY